MPDHKTITDEEVEQVAREYCRLRGDDPDALVPHGADVSFGGMVPAVLYHSPLWTRVAIEVRAAARMRQSFAVLDPPKPRPSIVVPPQRHAND